MKQSEKIDKMMVDVAVVLSQVKAIMAGMAEHRDTHQRQEVRLQKLERRVFAVWIIGPIALAVVGSLKAIKDWIGG